MHSSQTEPAAIIETSLLHRVHQEATAQLADAAQRASAPLAALAKLRDFVVANLHHHHETEDHVLWPSLTARDPHAALGLADLSTEHDMLDTALNALAATVLRDDRDRPALTEAAVTVRDLVHGHIDREEPILFPALRAYMPDDDWATFSRNVIASTPPEGAHLMIGFFDLVGSTAEVELVLANLPDPAQPMVPTMREQAHTVLGSLQPRN